MNLHSQNEPSSSKGKETNTYGIPMVNLEEAVENINSWPRRMGYYTQVNYDPSDGKILCKNFIDENSYSVYEDPDILYIGNFAHRVTAQEIADCIRETVRWYEKREGRNNEEI